MYIDTHCHYDMYKFPDKVVKNCEINKIVTIGMTNLPSHFIIGIKHIRNFKYVRMALGLHPLLASEHSKELDVFKRNINKTTYIGEVGLDYSREGYSTKEIQKKSFEFVLKSISGKNKLLSIHSRRAEKEVLSYLREYRIKAAIFHWYSGPLNLINDIVESGYYFSINPVMINSQQGQKIISLIPADRILTETDGPYTQSNNKPYYPKDVRLVIKYLAKLYKRTELEIENKIYSNFKMLLAQLK